VRVDSVCLDCGESVAVEMRDEGVLSIDPLEMVGYTYAEVGGPADNRPYR